MSKPDTQRILTLIASAERNNSWLTFEEAGDILGVAPSAIPSVAATLSTFGVPPFGPEDTLDIEVNRDHIRVTTPKGWSDWSSLPIGDVGLLLAALRSLHAGLDAQQRADANGLSKRLLATLPGELASTASQRASAVTWGLSADVDGELVSRLHQALAQKQVLRLHYYNHSRDVVQHREVRPHRVVQHDGRWYLSASLHTREGHRYWRLDRILSADTTSETFTEEGPPSDLFQRTRLYDAPPEQVRLTLQLSPAHASALAEAIADLEVDGHTATLTAPTLHVAYHRLLPHPEGWTVVAPPEAVAWFAALAPPDPARPPSSSAR